MARTLEELQREADVVRSRYVGERDRLREDTTITDGYRMAQIQDARYRQTAALNALAEEHRAALDGERESLRRRVFEPTLPWGATPADRVARDASFRDAMERARRTDVSDSGELDELASSARLVGDQLLGHACFVVGFERGHVDTVNAYLAEHPLLDEPATRLWDLSQATPIEADLSIAATFAAVAD